MSPIQVKNEDEMPEALSETLWSLATERLQVKLPQHERDQVRVLFPSIVGIVFKETAASVGN